MFSCEFCEIFKRTLFLEQFWATASEHSIYIYSLREKCPNTEFFLVRIFSLSDWIRRDTEILRISPHSVRMRENTGQLKLRIWTLFTQWFFQKTICLRKIIDLIRWNHMMPIFWYIQVTVMLRLNARGVY